MTAHRQWEVAEPLRQTDAPSDVLEIDGEMGFVKRNIKAIRETDRMIRERDPDVVLLDCRELLGLLVALVAVVHRVPLIFRFKGDYWAGLAEGYRPEKGDGIRKWVVNRLSLATNEVIYSLAAGFVVVSKPLRETVVEHTGCGLERVQAVHVPYSAGRSDGDSNRARKRFDIEEQHVVLSVSNFDYRSKYRGTKTSIDGICRFMQAEDDVSFVVAGDGPYHEDLVEHVDRVAPTASVRNRIHLPGFVTEIGDLYALADVFVYVSHLDGYPNAVLEAQQAGLPVVVNNAHGMVDQVDHGVNGLILDDPTAEAVSTAIRGLLESPSERERLGKNARQRVVEENNPAVIGPELLDALSTILERRDAGDRRPSGSAGATK